MASYSVTLRFVVDAEDSDPSTWDWSVLLGLPLGVRVLDCRPARALELPLGERDRRRAVAEVLRDENALPTPDEMRFARKAVGLSQSELARMAECARARVCHIEVGRHYSSRTGAAKRICELLADELDRAAGYQAGTAEPAATAGDGAAAGAIAHHSGDLVPLAAAG